LPKPHYISRIQKEETLSAKTNERNKVSPPRTSLRPIKSQQDNTRKDQIRLKIINPNHKSTLNAFDFENISHQNLKIPKVDCSMVISDINQKIEEIKERKIKMLQK